MTKTLLFILLFFINVSFGQENYPKSILSRSYKIIKDKKYVGYEAVYKIKFFGNADTSIFRSNVSLLKNKSDTIFGGSFWFSINNTEYKFYDFHKIYDVSKNERKVTVYDPYKGERSIISGSAASGVIGQFFFKPAKLNDLCNSSNKLSIGNDTNVNHVNCYRIEVDFPDEDDFTNSVSS